MSIEALNWVFDLPIKELRAKAILTALANYAHRERGTCFPSLKRIGLSAGCSEQTVRRALKDLERWGLIFIHRSPGRVTTYELNFEWQPKRECVDKPVENDERTISDPFQKEGHPFQIDQTPLPNQGDTPANGVTRTFRTILNPVGEGWPRDAFRESMRMILEVMPRTELDEAKEN